MGISGSAIHESELKTSECIRECNIFILNVEFGNFDFAVSCVNFEF